MKFLHNKEKKRKKKNRKHITKVLTKKQNPSQNAYRNNNKRGFFILPPRSKCSEHNCNLDSMAFDLLNKPVNMFPFLWHCSPF